MSLQIIIKFDDIPSPSISDPEVPQIDSIKKVRNSNKVFPENYISNSPNRYKSVFDVIPMRLTATILFLEFLAFCILMGIYG